MSVLTALIAGVLGLAAGLALERFRRSSTDRRWLLDNRHEDAVRFLAAANACSKEIRLKPARAAERADAVRQAEETYLAARITASEKVNPLNSRLWDALVEVDEAETQSDREAKHLLVIRRMNEVLSALRAEVQPPSRSWRRWMPKGRQRGRKQKRQRPPTIADATGGGPENQDAYTGSERHRAG